MSDVTARLLGAVLGIILLSIYGFAAYYAPSSCEVQLQIRDQEIFALKNELEAWKVIR